MDDTNGRRASRYTMMLYTSIVDTRIVERLQSSVRCGDVPVDESGQLSRRLSVSVSSVATVMRPTRTRARAPPRNRFACGDYLN